LENKIAGRESQGACHQGELTGGKPLVIKQLGLSLMSRVPEMKSAVQLSEMA
jgi:hypothetical protein